MVCKPRSKAGSKKKPRRRSTRTAKPKRRECLPITDDGAIRLSNAIIRQACKDYRTALRKLERLVDREDSLPRLVMSEVESFFLHSKIVSLRDLDGQRIVSQLRYQVSLQAKAASHDGA